MRAIEGIGTIERLDSLPPPSQRYLKVTFPDWEMYVGSDAGESVRQEIEEIIDIYGKGNARLNHVRGSSRRIGISVDQPPEDEIWFDFCWEIIELIRNFGDIPIFDEMETEFVFD